MQLWFTVPSPVDPVQPMFTVTILHRRGTSAFSNVIQQVLDLVQDTIPLLHCCLAPKTHMDDGLMWSSCYHLLMEKGLNCLAFGCLRRAELLVVTSGTTRCSVPGQHDERSPPWWKARLADSLSRSPLGSLATPLSKAVFDLGPVTTCGPAMQQDQPSWSDPKALNSTGHFFRGLVHALGSATKQVPEKSSAPDEAHEELHSNITGERSIAKQHSTQPSMIRYDKL